MVFINIYVFLRPIRYRLNRSIQVERPFGDIKENYDYDRFRRKGLRGVEFEFS
ncbi:transposase, partial [Streptobacillus ratti]|uniref:transposase n=1 Tax=Streptobacillus ratti TaxID=1720557 RepID=UPI0039EA16AD